MPESYRSRVNESGRVVIPVELRKEFGIGEGEELIFSKDEQGIRITTLQQAITGAQSYFAALALHNVRMSDELLSDRRREAMDE